MKIYQEVSDLADVETWYGTEETKRIICDAGKGETFMFELEMLYPSGIGEDQLNEMLRFNREACLKIAGIECEEED